LAFTLTLTLTLQLSVSPCIECGLSTCSSLHLQLLLRPPADDPSLLSTRALTLLISSRIPTEGACCVLLIRLSRCVPPHFIYSFFFEFEFFYHAASPPPLCSRASTSLTRPACWRGPGRPPTLTTSAWRGSWLTSKYYYPPWVTGALRSSWGPQTHSKSLARTPLGCKSGGVKKFCFFCFF
jgi:hypothetical protein